LGSVAASASLAISGEMLPPSPSAELIEPEQRPATAPAPARCSSSCRTASRSSELALMRRKTSSSVVHL